ncbi:MAG: lamin tail domain-containing protein [bacterium]
MRRKIVFLAVLCASGFFIALCGSAVKAMMFIPEVFSSFDLTIVEEASSTDKIVEEGESVSNDQILTTSSSTSETEIAFDYSLSVSASSTSASSVFVSTTPASSSTSSVFLPVFFEASASTTDALPTIIISEIMPNPDQGNEWVELYNFGFDNFDLNGMLICDSTGKACKSASGTIDGLSWNVVDMGGARYLNNDNDEVVLLSSTGSVIDSVIYGGVILAPNKGQTLARNENDFDSGWIVSDLPSRGNKNIFPIVVEEGNNLSASTSIDPVAQSLATSSTVLSIETSSTVASVLATSTGAISTTSTASFENIASDNPTSLTGANSSEKIAQENSEEQENSTSALENHADCKKEIVISQLFAYSDGHDADEEFIALKNMSTTTVDMSGWIVTDITKQYKIKGQIAPLQEMIITRASSSIALNNFTAETVGLIDACGNLMDSVSYSKAVKLAVYTRDNSGQWSWVKKIADQNSVQNNNEQDDKEEIFLKSTSSTAFDDLLKISLLNNETIDDLQYSGVIFATSVDQYDGEVSAVNQAVMMDIPQARQASKGEKATVSGIVTVMPDILGSQFFYISDSFCGLQIYNYKKDFPPLDEGDYIEVEGEMSEAYGVLRLKTKNKNDIRIVKSKISLKAELVELSDLDESRFGGLVKAKGTTTEIGSNYMYIDDGLQELKVVFKANAKIDKKIFKEGLKIEVVGIFEMGKQEWQLLPRSQADILIIPEFVPEAIAVDQSGSAVQQPTGSAGSENDAKEAQKYLFVTAGGAAAIFMGLLGRVKGMAILRGGKKIVAFATSFLQKH